MLNSNEIGQAQMDLNMLSLFDYVTQGISSDVDLDCDIPNNNELNFDN